MSKQRLFTHYFGDDCIPPHSVNEQIKPSVPVAQHWSSDQPQPIKPPPILEADFQRTVQEFATAHGWEWVHWLRAQHGDSWRTAYRGSLGKGWPDLTLTRERDGRLLALELKADGRKPTPDQLRVLGILKACGFETGWFTPAHWDLLEGVLR